jgi:hypothetical protein
MPGIERLGCISMSASSSRNVARRLEVADVVHQALSMPPAGWRVSTRSQCTRVAASSLSIPAQQQLTVLGRELRSRSSSEADRYI